MSRSDIDRVEKAEKAYRRVKEVVRIDPRQYVGVIVRETGNPFELLIATMLSQNTNDRNAIRAYRNLKRKFELKPEVLARADLSELEEAIKVAGLYRMRARAIKEVSEEVLKRYEGDLGRVLSLPLEEARGELSSLPKVGPKTSDVLLLMMADRATMPVDTHITRISRRLGIVSPKAGYEEIRAVLMKAIPKDEYLHAHLALIAFGRTYCKARKPRCPDCPLRDICDYALASSGLTA